MSAKIPHRRNLREAPALDVTQAQKEVRSFRTPRWYLLIPAKERVGFLLVCRRSATNNMLPTDGPILGVGQSHARKIRREYAYTFAAPNDPVNVAGT